MVATASCGRCQVSVTGSHPKSSCLNFGAWFDIPCPACGCWAGAHCGRLIGYCVACAKCGYAAERSDSATPKTFGPWGWRDDKGAFHAPVTVPFSAKQVHGKITDTNIQENKYEKQKCNCTIAKLLAEGCRDHA